MSVAESACGHACRWAVQAQPTKGSAVMGSHDVGAHGPVHTVEHGQALSARPGKGPGLPGSAVAGRAAGLAHLPNHTLMYAPRRARSGVC
jgi:hypothetical protein